MKYQHPAFVQKIPLVAMFVAFLAVAAIGQFRITLNIDASEAARNVVHVKERLTVKPGRFAFFYPKWIPGEHSPTGPINNMVNLFVTADGKPIAWQRDDVEMFAFRCNIPAGLTSVDVTFDDVAETGTTASAQLARLKWNRLLVYQRSIASDKIVVSASLKLPDGWQYATALPVKREASGQIEFNGVTLETLVDSPAIIGKNFKMVSLSDDKVLQEIDIAADTPEALVYKPETLQGWKNLVIQANLMFGARHYNSYRFLVTLSDVGGSEGLEHHQSSEDGVGLNAMSNPEQLIDLGDLLGHEYAHSWNGKYRRPLGLSTPDFEQPMKGDLLWVYEGLTEYLGNVLPTRSGLWTPDVFRETVADVAAQMQYQSGRSWRPLVDTARAVQFTYPSSRSWMNTRRRVDYYYEGVLIWLEADVLIREKTAGNRSLDDFLHEFHGGQNSAPVVRPYSFDDVVAALNKVLPYDWSGFLQDRVYKVKKEAPLAGITSGGWKLVFSDAPNLRIEGGDKLHNTRDLMYSIGLIVNESGTILDIQPDLAAGKAGLSPGMTIKGKEGNEFSLEDLVKAVSGSNTTAEPIKLDVDNGGSKQTYSLDYHGGSRYPHLVRNGSGADVLSDIIKAR